MRPYDQRLEQLLRQAAHVFAQKGYHPTTMRHLSATTGMSLAGMYYYVRGKEQLLELIQERCFEQVIAGAETALAEPGEPLEKIQAFIRHHVAFFAAHMDEMKVLSHEAASLGGAGRQRVRAYKRRYVDLLEGLLRDAAPHGPAAERSAAAFALFGMMNWIYTWYDPDGPLDPRQLADLFARIFAGYVEARAPVQEA